MADQGDARSLRRGPLAGDAGGDGGVLPGSLHVVGARGDGPPLAGGPAAGAGAAVRGDRAADGGVDDAAWPAIEERLRGVDAVAIGPGLGRAPSTSAVVRRVVAESPVPVVLDADGLNAFAGDAGPLADRAAPAVLTPHAGEFARLTGLSADEIAADRLGHVRKAAEAWRCVVLLKGPRTLVVDPSGTARVNPTGGPALATGGTGDVLTGTIAALAARGLAAFDAAAAGAYLHGASGDLAAELEGEGTIASDVASLLPDAVAGLAAGSGAQTP